jgi:flagellar motor switch protein FliN/FliY
MTENHENVMGEQSVAQDLDFAEIEKSGDGIENPRGLDFLLDVPLEVTVELGRTRIQIGELLKLGQGSIVELERLTNEPVDIFINHKLMAHGEVVVVNERIGIRLTNIISPGARVKKLT